MRRSRRLTEGEQWELGLFLGMLSVGCICLMAVFHFDGLPRLFGWAVRSSSQASSEAPRPAPSPPLSPPYTPPTPPLLERGTPPAVAGALRPGSLADGSLSGIFPSLPMEPGMPSAGPKSKLAQKPLEEIRWYKGEKFRYVKTLKLRVTAYAADPRCCWPYPGTTTASGLSVKTNHGKLVAADTSMIPMHALVTVPGYGGGAAVPVLDRGGAIKGRRLDVLLPTFEQAKDWGTRMLEVKVYMPVE